MNIEGLHTADKNIFVTQSSAKRLTTNTKKMENIIQGLTKVDSSRLSIPLKDCRIIDTNLIDRIQIQTINADTGVLVKESGKNGMPTVIENADGTYLKFWKENQFFYSEGKKIPTLYITFLVNSKHLTKGYFNAITIDTLPQIYEYILSFNIVHFEYKHLLNSRYNDTDICVDFITSQDSFKKLKTSLKSQSLHPQLWFEAKNQPNNSGIWTPTQKEPRDNATSKKPFVKLYSKSEDFLFKSTEFSNKYFTLNDHKDKYRIEATIKNAEHKRHLGIGNSKTFGEFLKLDLQLLLQQIVKEYFVKESPFIASSNELTPTDKLIINLMNDLIQRGANKNELFTLFDLKDISRQARLKLKEKYHKLTALDEFNRKELESNSVTKELFSYLGISIDK
jgi:hypothetical protein